MMFVDSPVYVIVYIATAGI